jgi:large subunit ribosomal protein L24
MKSAWSKDWNASVQPRKQRKYRYNAPLHIKSKFLKVHLTAELRKKYGKRSLNVRTGDKIKILVGDKKGNEAKVSKVDVKNVRVFIEGMERIKMDGSKVQIAFDPSNLIITNIDKEDRRIKKNKTAKKEGKKPEAKETTPKPVKKKEKPKQEAKAEPTNISNDVRNGLQSSTSKSTESKKTGEKK